MQRKNLKYLLPILGGALLFVGFNWFGPQQEKEAVIFALVRDALTNVHLQPKEMNDELSAEVFDAYIESLDYNKLFFTQGEVDDLATSRMLLDEAFFATNTQFFEASYTKVLAGIKRSRSIYTELLEQPLEYTTSERIVNNPDARTFATDEAALRKSWEQHLKWRIINRIYEKDRAQKEDAETDETVELKSFETLEVAAREKELELQEDWYSDMMDVSRLEWFGMYMNAYCEAYDPHTSYLAPQQNENFEMSMTGQFEGIGAQLKKIGDYITIERIIAGSACWRQGDLEAGDKIIAVAQGEAEPVDVIGYKIRDAIKLIRGEKGSEVRLTVKKKDGSRAVIPIIRDVVELESTFARSAVLEGATYEKKDGSFVQTSNSGVKTGYIKLPKFYVNFYKDANRNAAEDVKKELIRLKEQGVEGIVLDLRNNGGGSLPAAIEIAGLFTEKGPQVQVKNFQSGTRAKNNKDGKIYWDGPLVVLINNYSASASEIVSAALQDRGRALIVGPSKSTFGKGTVQNMFDLDRAVNGNLNELKPLGAIKITTEKFYRISGGTTQLQGVVPDVALPGPYDQIEIGEKEYENALAIDYVERANYLKENHRQGRHEKAVKRALKRTENAPEFNRYKAYADFIAGGDEDRLIPLSYTEFAAFQDSLRTISDQYKNLGKAKDSMAVAALPYQLEMFATDSVQQDIYQKWFKGLSKDVILRESTYIIQDMIK
jgi:carboxyl-terminal processing protease